MFGHDQLNDGVAEEFQALIVEGIALALERDARMGHGFGQKQTVAKLVTKPTFDRIHDRSGMATRLARLMGWEMPLSSI